MDLVERLVEAFREKRKIEPEKLEISVDEAYELQKKFVEKLGNQIGWKIGASNEEVQKRLGINEPLFGRLLKETVMGRKARLDDFILPVGIEVEIAFKFHRDPPEMSLSGILSSSRIAPAFEIINGVFSENPTVQHLIVSNVRHAGVLFGDFRRCDFPLEHEEAILFINGNESGRGSGKNVLGHPAAPVLWLMERLERIGEKIRREDIVISGTMIPPVFLDEPSEIRASYSSLGELELHLI